MIALYIIAGIVALIAVILSLNVSARVIFNSSAKDEMNIYAKVGFYKIHIIPAKPEKEKKPKKIKEPKIKKEKPAKPEKAVKAKPEKVKKKYSIPEIFNVVKEIGIVLAKRFKKHFRVKIYNINVILATEEAQKTAMLYGAAIQSAHYLYEFLDYNFKIRKKQNNIKIIPDFSKLETSFNIDIKFYMRISHIFALGLAALFKFLAFWTKAGKIPAEKSEQPEKLEKAENIN